MDKKKNISMAVIRRLPKYHRYLYELLKNDVDRISSKELSERIGFTASQIRQDLNCFGDFGQQGYGYNVSELHHQISNILGLNNPYNIIIIGAGNIGQALANYTRFSKLGFNVKAMFDTNPKLIGLKIRDIEILDIDYLSDYLEKNNIDIGIICVPHDNAQKVANILVKNDIKGIWNFAPIDLAVPEDVVVENVHLSDSLLTLTCLINKND
ncbi:redox-sensing transcriptional repressor Rex [Clostridium sp. FAM 1755]|uniref:Redox-sensing transcriptional repressor Rex n=2 Tax=Clostridium TaxID=1485 RepID=A0A6M0SXY0_CLOBO|nr:MULTISPECIES: redox-sensing transcriptional repressor Rex [Clostridium]EJP6472211.1 redox-sensing transcriptional repressor Rex [Clostridium botulinum]KOR25000.1 REX family transcriptional regulator [Clostridium sp. L74]MDS1005357.1 redox-sensing transcriptional repressor Rex [Clostridium sporogenes]NFA59422.1 redox-sensing transcriptional repressor Rex [Clostridium botulinum]NFI74606.1 redox-sensing transcriptional repressor Rex [Clostridium sporogenes]